MAAREDRRRQGKVRRVPGARGGEPVSAAEETIPTIADVDALVAWMDSEGLPGKGEPLEHRYISGGSQNEIYELKRGDLHAAMRIPPPHAPADRDKGIF